MALDAGALLVDRFRGPARDVHVKSSATDMVSAADEDAEAMIHRVLRSERPDDGLLGEEGGREKATSGRRWLVDPLDGTTNFLYGIPVWAVSVALEDEDGGLVGVVFDPLREELFTAARGEGARLNDEPLTMRPHDELATALVATGFAYDPAQRAKQAQVLVTLLPAVRDIRRAGAAALDLCALAAGRVDAYYERNLNPWDWSAAHLIVAEAGGAVVDMEGEPHGLAAASPALLPKLLSLLEEAEARPDS